ncbi:MAG: efflux RND transporter periplasmic adaptor subunit [Myxococcota bacterium]
MWKKIVVTVVGLLVVTALLGGTKAMQIVALIEAAENGGPPPQAVSTAVAQAEEWEKTVGAVGTLVAVQGVTVSTEVPGTVETIGFESGDDVKKGSMLLRLDISVEEAQRASAVAERKLADTELERAKGLRAKGVNSLSEYDEAELRFLQAEAALQNIEATIARKVIRAPFSGRLGTRQVNLGEFLDPGSPVVSLTSLDPLYVDFTIPQRDIGLVDEKQELRISIDAFPGEAWTGVVDSIDPVVDASTRNLRIRGIVKNEGKRLRPGLFVDVRVLLPSSQPVVAIPATSVLYAPYGNSVFVVEEVEDEEKGVRTVARQVFVRLGPRRGDLVAVASGIEAGQTVVSSGAFKLRNGAPVIVNNELAPDAKIAPKPEDS